MPIIEIGQETLILLVEDDDGHSTLIRKNLRRGGLDNEIIPLKNGQLAIDYLRKYITQPLSRKPILVLLDLNMPVMDGFQVLEIVKNDKRMSKIPIIILTTTDNPGEIDRCYDLGCNIYITKPVECDRFADAIKKLGFMVGVMKVSEKQSKSKE